MVSMFWPSSMGRKWIPTNQSDLVLQNSSQAALVPYAPPVRPTLTQASTKGRRCTLIQSIYIFCIFCVCAQPELNTNFNALDGLGFSALWRSLVVFVFVVRRVASALTMIATCAPPTEFDFSNSLRSLSNNFDVAMNFVPAKKKITKEPQAFGYIHLECSETAFIRP